MNGASDPAKQLARGVAREFRRRMLDEYVPRIARCVSMLQPEQVWNRPNAVSNSVGNLLLHLEGNVRQWILAGLGGEHDVRDRPAEFAARAAPLTPGELVDRLRQTVTGAAALVDGLGPDDLLATRRFQDRYDDTGLAAVLHVIEHFSGHAAQIYAFTKQVTGEDLRFYDL